MTIFTNQTVLITGATGGFGTEFAQQLFQKGSRLILTDLVEETLRQQAQTLDPSGNSGQIVATIPSDLSDAEGANQLFAQVQALDTRVDMLINNAGIAVIGRHDEVPADAWERLMQINLMAPMRLSALLVPQMIEQRSGHIVNISSVAGWIATDGLTAYAASKFGLRGFSETLAGEVEPHGVKVSAVYPYFSRTPILDSPRYGSMASSNLREQVNELGVTNPADMVAEALAQIEQGRLHIFPDRMGRTIYWLKHYAPWLLKILSQRFT